MSHSSPSLSSCCFRTAGTIRKPQDVLSTGAFFVTRPAKRSLGDGDWAGVRTRLTLPCFLSSKCEAVATGLSVPDLQWPLCHLLE